MGFAVPLASWFRGPLEGRVRVALLGERLADTGLFNQGYLRHLVDDHQAGRKECTAPRSGPCSMFDAFLTNVLAAQPQSRAVLDAA